MLPDFYDAIDRSDAARCRDAVFRLGCHTALPHRTTRPVRAIELERFLQGVEVNLALWR